MRAQTSYFCHPAELWAALPEAQRARVKDDYQLQNWHDRLAPDEVMRDYRRELDAVRKLSPDEHMTQFVHGKKFYNQVVVQVLDRLFSGQGADDWFQRFRDTGIQPPPDLIRLLDWILTSAAEDRGGG